jgi:hypothetical protein
LTTQLFFTKPFLPSTDEIKHAGIPIDLLHQRREEENEKFYNDLLEHLEKVRLKKAKKAKRKNTLENERIVIQTYEELVERNEKEFNNRFRNEDVKKNKVTAQDVWDYAGDQLGYKNPRPIQTILRAYKEKKK